LDTTADIAGYGAVKEKGHTGCETSLQNQAKLELFIFAFQCLPLNCLDIAIENKCQGQALAHEYLGRALLRQPRPIVLSGETGQVRKMSPWRAHSMRFCKILQKV
jgi:hypothetical protein